MWHFPVSDEKADKDGMLVSAQNAVPKKDGTEKI